MLKKAGPCVLFPCLITTAATTSTSVGGDLEQAGFREEGEGYGPRKEFFLLAGQALTGQSAGKFCCVF